MLFGVEGDSISCLYLWKEVWKDLMVLDLRQ